MIKRQKFDSSTKIPEGESVSSPVKSRKTRYAVGKKNAGSVASGGSGGSGKIEYFSTPIKAESDSKEYQVIKLPNGLVATLISDVKHLIDLDQSPCHSRSRTPSDKEANSSAMDTSSSSSGSESEIEESSKEKLAACALTVEVGSFSDPEDIQGLSHFLEHMVFMGSEKYPKENEFDVFIKRYGGSDNAFTECEYTTYHFECPEKYLLKAMDIWSQFYIKPLLKMDAINREREAVESEFQGAFQDDVIRKDQLLCSFASNDNPARKFTWGSQYTLRDNVTDKHLHETVNEYREKHYSSDRMKVAVQGRVPIDVLKNWVVECFSKVPKVPNCGDDFKPMEQPFDRNKFCRFYYVDTVKDVTEIEIRWVLPPVVRKYKTKPLKYLSFVIGHEGKGSLLSYLKKKLWALNLQADYAEDGLNKNSIYTIFIIRITLTDEGRTEIGDVLTSTFSYMKMLRNAGPNQRIFQEVKALADIGFRFSEETPASDNVESITQNMVLFPPEDYLRGTELFFEYNPNEIQDFLSKMIPSDINIMFSSKNHGVCLEEEEFWFKTKYRGEPIPEKWVERWNNVEVYPEFHLPEENPFIPTDFNLVDHSNVPKYPSKVRDTELVEMWYKGDDKFLLPIASIDILIITPKSLRSAERSLYVDMFIKLLQYHLSEELFHAVAADMEYSFTMQDRGIQLSVYGYNQHLDLLLEGIANGIKNFNKKADENVLEAFKKMLARSYYNDTLTPRSLARDIRVGSYMTPYYSSSQKYKYTKTVTLAKLNEFVDTFFDEVHIQVLVQGNITLEAGNKIVDKFLHTVKPKKGLSKEQFPESRVKILPTGEICCRIKSFNLDDRNCVTTVYYQYGPATIREYVALELFVMIMEEPLFDTLRTQQQLGYEVTASVRETFGIIGVSVTVQSQINKFTVEHVKEKIDEFVYGFVKDFPDIPEEEFFDSQNSLMNIKSTVDTHLKEESKRNFDEIRAQEFVFNRQEKEIHHISRFVKDDVAEIVMKLVSPNESNHKKLVVQVVGTDNTSKVNVIESVEDTVDQKAPCKHSLPDDIVYNFLSAKDFPDGYFITDFENWKNSLSEYPPHKLTK